jgi:single-strand DNA-binding protein
MKTNNLGGIMNPKVTLVGRIGQNPEPIGSGIRMRLATNDRVKNESTGQWEDKDTSWWTVKAWKSVADSAKNIIRKGQEVIIVGNMREENWTDKDGNKRVSYEIIADSIAVTTKSLSKDSLVSSESSPWN